MRAARQLGVASLRDLSPAMLDGATGLLSDTDARRCRHVITEIARVERAAAHLRAADLRSVGELLYASHASLRDDYEVSCPELDVLVQIASEVSGVFGAKMTGGGFGGSAVALVSPEAVPLVREAVTLGFERRFHRTPRILTTAACGAAREL